jgi:serine/threonine protein kinase
LIAPEVLQKGKFTERSLWWCFGSVLYELLTHKKPFALEDQPVHILFQKIMKGQLQYPDNINQHAQELLHMVLFSIY